MRIAVLHIHGIDLGVLACLTEAFRRLGHRVRVWRVPEVDDAVKSPAPGAASEVRRWERLLAAVRAFRPDFGFGLDTFPLLYEPPRSRNPKPETRNWEPGTGNSPPLRHLFDAAGAPLAIFWTVDPIRGLLALDSVPPMGLSRTGVTHFVPDSAAAAALRSLGLRARYLSHGTFFHEAHPSAAALRRFRADVAFVGHAAVRETGEEATTARYGAWLPALARRAGRAVARGAPLPRALAEAFAALPPAARGAARAVSLHPQEVGQIVRYAAAHASVTTRCRIVGGLGRPALAYGDPTDWPAGRSGIVRHPAVDYRRELPAVYRASAVNLNVTDPQFPRGVNQRVFDVPAAGGFLLTDRRADLARHFAPGREAVVYDDLPDLRAKVRWHLDHPLARRRVVDRARARAAAEHSWLDRARVIVRAMA